MKIKLNKPTEWESVVITILLIPIALWGLTISLPKPDGSTIIKAELAKQGYDVAGVEFTYLMDGAGRDEEIYRSSAPVYYEGDYVSEWVLTRYMMGYYSPHCLYEVESFTQNRTAEDTSTVLLCGWQPDGVCE